MPVGNLCTTVCIMQIDERAVTFGEWKEHIPEPPGKLDPDIRSICHMTASYLGECIAVMTHTCFEDNTIAWKWHLNLANRENFWFPKKAKDGNLRSGDERDMPMSFIQGFLLGSITSVKMYHKCDLHTGMWQGDYHK